MKSLAIAWQHLNVEVETLYAKLLARGKTIDKLERKLKKLRRKSANQHRYLGKYSKFEDENSELKARNIKLDDTCNELVGQVNKLTAKNEGLMAENEELKKSNCDLSKRGLGLALDFEAARREIHSLRQEVLKASKWKWFKWPKMPNNYQWWEFNQKLSKLLQNLTETTAYIAGFLILAGLYALILYCFGWIGWHLR